MDLAHLIRIFILIKALSIPVLVFALLTFAGYVIFSSVLASRTRNGLIILGGSMISGLLGFLLTLSIFSYIFKGSLAILILFLLYILGAFLVYLPRSKIVN